MTPSAMSPLARRWWTALILSLAVASMTAAFVAALFIHVAIRKRIVVTEMVRPTYALNLRDLPPELVERGLSKSEEFRREGPFEIRGTRARLLPTLVAELEAHPSQNAWAYLTAQERTALMQTGFLTGPLDVTWQAWAVWVFALCNAAIVAAAILCTYRLWRPNRAPPN